MTPPLQPIIDQAKTMKSDSAFGVKLPYDFLPAYQSYKKSTAVLVRWLIDHGDTSHTKKRTLSSVNQLLNLARMVKENSSTVPSHVLQALKTSIKKRGKITDFFKSIQDGDHPIEDEITRSHEHFTSTQVLGHPQLKKKSITCLF